MFIIRTFQGDSAENQTFNITRTDGSIVDLTGASVRLIIQDPKTGIPTNNANNTCAIQGDPTAGVCTYTWNQTDLPDVGIYNANLKIDFPGNKEKTAPGKIVAEQPIYNAVIS